MTAAALALAGRLLRGIPLWAWALATALGWGAWQRHRAVTAVQQVAQASQIAIASEAARTTEHATATALHQVETHAHVQITQTRRAAAAAAIAGDGLRQRSAATAAAAASSAAAGRCSDAAAPVAVLSDLLAGLEGHGRAVAEWADDLDTALQACQQSYSAVTTTPTLP